MYTEATRTLLTINKLMVVMGFMQCAMSDICTTCDKSREVQRKLHVSAQSLTGDVQQYTVLSVETYKIAYIQGSIFHNNTSCDTH